MNQIIYKEGIDFNENDIKELYTDAGWNAYLKDNARLIEGIKSSLFVITAWDEDEMVGLIRVIGDGLTIIYIQDILVKKAYKRRGIGSELVSEILDRYKDVRQKVLLTDDSEETRGFYEANGFFSCDKGNVVAFAKFD
ncbi:MAG: GNAT family N-acetyltransferase [Epulopiscium sp.]|nr:GNAT family N-acetyltransferase [Candidatus Epulonipiscium sp.]